MTRKTKALNAQASYTKTGPLGLVIDFTASRFMKLVDVRGADECWNYIGSTAKNGYGCFWLKRGKVTRSHRFAFEQANGPIPAGKLVLHACNNRKCCNPAHLYLGNAKQNAADAVKAGAIGKRKLDPAKAREIVLRCKAGKETQNAIAADYGICVQQVYNVWTGRAWAKHTADLRVTLIAETARQQEAVA